MRRVPAIACLVLLALAAPALARTAFVPDPVDLTAARKEGAVTWYTSTPIAPAQKIANLFQAETGIKLELFRSGGSAVVRRFFQEVDARRVVADVLTVSDPTAVSALIKRDLLVPFRPRHFDKVRDEVKDPRGYHVAQRLNLVGIVVRTDKNLQLPRNWTDLTDPRYKGLMVMPDPSYTAIQLMVVGTLSRLYGWEFYQKLRASEIEGAHHAPEGPQQQSRFAVGLGVHEPDGQPPERVQGAAVDLEIAAGGGSDDRLPVPGGPVKPPRFFGFFVERTRHTCGPTKASDIW